jgi:hypothetical protein
VQLLLPEYFWIWAFLPITSSLWDELFPLSTSWVLQSVWIFATKHGLMMRSQHSFLATKILFYYFK